MRQICVSGFVRSDLPAEISMSHVGSNPMFQTFCQQSSATVTAKKGGKRPVGGAASLLRRNWESGRPVMVRRSAWPVSRHGLSGLFVPRHRDCNEPGEATIHARYSGRPTSRLRGGQQLLAASGAVIPALVVNAWEPRLTS